MGFGGARDGTSSFIQSSSTSYSSGQLSLESCLLKKIAQFHVLRPDAVGSNLRAALNVCTLRVALPASTRDVKEIS
jgi:hypothetical protein